MAGKEAGPNALVEKIKEDGVGAGGESFDGEICGAVGQIVGVEDLVCVGIQGDAGDGVEVESGRGCGCTSQ